MATFQDILDQVATVVGGNQPDPTGNPFWYSGDAKGDGSGISGMKGCYAVPPETIQTTPVGVIISHQFETTYYPSHKMDEDVVRLLILVARRNARTSVGILNPYRDTVPAAFDQHMRLNASTNVWQTLVKRGHTSVVTWGAIPYLAWEFDLHVNRNLNETFTE